MTDIFAPLAIAPTPAAAKAWLKALAASPYSYHLDDDPASIVQDGNGKRVFTAPQCKVIRDNLKACQRVMTWDDIWEVYYAAFQEANP